MADPRSLEADLLAVVRPPAKCVRLDRRAAFEGDTLPTRTSDRVTPVDTPAAEDADPAPQSADGAGEAGQAMGVGR